MHNYYNKNNFSGQYGDPNAPTDDAQNAQNFGYPNLGVTFDQGRQTGQLSIPSLFNGQNPAPQDYFNQSGVPTPTIRVNPGGPVDRNSYVAAGRNPFFLFNAETDTPYLGTYCSHCEAIGTTALLVYNPNSLPVLPQYQNSYQSTSQAAADTNTYPQPAPPAPPEPEPVPVARLLSPRSLVAQLREHVPAEQQEFLRLMRAWADTALPQAPVAGTAGEGRPAPTAPTSNAPASNAPMPTAPAPSAPAHVAPPAPAIQQAEAEAQLGEAAAATPELKPIPGLQATTDAPLAPALQVERSMHSMTVNKACVDCHRARAKCEPSDTHNLCQRCQSNNKTSCAHQLRKKNGCDRQAMEAQGPPPKKRSKRKHTTMVTGDQTLVQSSNGHVQVAQAGGSGSSGSRGSSESNGPPWTTGANSSGHGGREPALAYASDRTVMMLGLDAPFQQAVYAGLSMSQLNPASQARGFAPIGASFHDAAALTQARGSIPAQQDYQAYQAGGQNIYDNPFNFGGVGSSSLSRGLQAIASLATLPPDSRPSSPQHNTAPVAHTPPDLVTDGASTTTNPPELQMDSDMDALNKYLSP